MTKEWLAANPNTALDALAAVLEGQNMMWADPAKAAEYYTEFREIEPADAEALIADFQSVGNRTMMWVDGAFENPKTVLSTVNPDISGVDITTAYDRSFLEQLQDPGRLRRARHPHGYLRRRPPRPADPTFLRDTPRSPLGFGRGAIVFRYDVDNRRADWIH